MKVELCQTETTAEESKVVKVVVFVELVGTVGELGVVVLVLDE